MNRFLTAAVFLASTLCPAAALPGGSAAATATTPAPLVSTGVIAPKIIRSAAIPAAVGNYVGQIDGAAEVELSLQIDAKGQVQNVQITKSPSMFLNAPVLSALRQFRFRPATLNNKPIPVEMNLTVQLQQ